MHSLLAHEDISLLLYQAGFGNEILTLANKHKTVQCILFNQIFKQRPDQISDIIDELDTVGILELLQANKACLELVLPLTSEVAISADDILRVLDFEVCKSEEENQVKYWFTDYVKLLKRGNFYLLDTYCMCI